MTGKAVFENGADRLEVYTANRGPLEKMFGVDLIYINQSVGNAVMVQYKMLEEGRASDGEKDWICRMNHQFEDEIGRMVLPPIQGTVDDYRLSRAPFYFKFVRRRGDGETHHSWIISLEHLKQLLGSAAVHGPNDGIRLSFRSLNGVFLRESNLIGLIQSGYIGTHRVESDALQPIIQAASEGDRAVVLAWQHRIRESMDHQDD